LHSFLPFILFRPAGAGLDKQKTRDCFGNRGSFEICWFRLEDSSHDASGAVPSGHQSLDALALANRKRACHI